MSEAPLGRKLQIKEGYKVLLVDEPPDYRSKIGQQPTGVSILDKAAGPVDLVQVFVTSRKGLEQELGQLKKLLKPKGLLWVTYPKGTSGVKADINRDSIRAYAQSIGLTAVAMVSIDDTWLALRLKIT